MKELFVKSLSCIVVACMLLLLFASCSNKSLNTDINITNENEEKSYTVSPLTATALAVFL